MKKMIFRILGALASALIIISVFVPFKSASLASIWESYTYSNAMYLPIMIIVFGAIGVIFFSLNIKTEFAYMSTGAISFFIVMKTIEILNQGSLSSFGIGYYFLVVGALITGIMAFLLNLKPKKVKQKNTNLDKDPILDRIDRLYDDQVPDEVVPIQPIGKIQSEDINVIPIQPIENVSTIDPSIQTQVEEPINSIPESSSIIEPTVSQSDIQREIEPIEVVKNNPVIDEFIASNNLNQSINNSIPDTLINMQTETIENQNMKPINQFNSTVNEFMVNNSMNSIVNNTMQNSQVSVQPEIMNNQNINPINEFNSTANGFMQNNNINQNFNNSINQESTEITPLRPNPVVQEFANPNSTVTYNQNVNQNETDIFGQPINR